MIFDPGPIVPLKGQIAQTLKLTWLDINKDRFCRSFDFYQYFWFSSGKLDPKEDQSCKLWVRSIRTKTQNIEGFFKACICLNGDYLWSKFQQDQAIFRGASAQKKPKEEPWSLNRYKNFRKIVISQPHMVSWVIPEKNKQGLEYMLFLIPPWNF